MERRTTICGIAGIVKYGKKPLSEAAISLLLTGNEARGNDASGIALSQEDGSINVFKNDSPAWQFINSDGYKEFIKNHLKPSTWGVIIHTRAATKGSPKDNNNNHPMYAGLSAVVHNGILNNDDYLFGKEKIERKAETDSDILRGFIDKYGITEKCIKEMNALGGSAAGAAFHPHYPRKLLLFRSGNPMILASTEDFFMFSSEKKSLYRALKPFVKRFNMWFHVERPEAAFSPMADDTAWILGDNGQEKHAIFKVLVGQYHEPNRRVYENYKERQEKWNKDKKKLDPAYCSKCQKSWLVPEGRKPSDFKCNTKEGGCGAWLSVPPSTV